MPQHRGRAIGGTIAALGCLVALLVVLQLHRSDTSAAGPPRTSGPVYLDDGTVFTPKTQPTKAPYLTADEAWTRWERGEHLTPDITPTFGQLNDQGRNHVVWAYHRPGCTLSFQGPPRPQKSPECSSWTFLDPRTGRHVLTTSVLSTTP